MKIPGRRLASDRGDAMVEMALSLIFLLLMLFGILDFGRALYTYHFVSHAAREATRWAAVNGSTCGPGVVAGTPKDGSCNGTAPMNNGPASTGDIQNYITTYLTPPGINPASISVTACGTTDGGTCADSNSSMCSGAGDAPACMVEVTVSYPFNFVAPIVSAATITMSSTSEMVIAH